MFNPMTPFDASFLGELYEAKLREAELRRLINSLPKHKRDNPFRVLMNFMARIRQRSPEPLKRAIA